MKHYILDRTENEPKPVVCENYETWAKWFASDDRRVAVDDIDKFQISTVFLGVDHGYNSESPILFETLVFQNDVGAISDPIRYTTWEKAVKGHQLIVQQCDILPALTCLASIEGASNLIGSLLT